jgi:short-subunit dehydrogenase
MRISGAVALVTGASSGIGQAAARRLAQAGATVVAQGRDETRLAELSRLTGAATIAADLSEPAGVQRVAAVALEAHGRVDILVNNAGLGWAGDLPEMSGSEVEHLIAVNLTAPIELTRLLLPGMLARGTGHLMFVTSIAGRTGVAGEAVYSATKGGLDTFAESLRLEVHGTGVEVGVLVPGVVGTAFFERRGRPYTRKSPRPMSVDVVADALVAGIAAGRAERYTPGWLRLPVAVRGAAPGVYRRLAARFGGS